MVTPYYRPIVGGITTFVESLSAALRNHGHEVRIWTQRGEATSEVELGPESPSRFVVWARRKLKAWRPDVIHSHAHWYTLAAALSPRATIARRVVFTVHTDVELRRGSIKARLLESMLSRASVVTLPSRYSREAFQRQFPRVQRTAVLLPGIRELESTPAEVTTTRRSLHINGCFPTITAVSMMVWPEKVRGLELLIRSMPKILRQYPDASLVLVGDGPLRGRLEYVASGLGVAGSVRFVGSFPNPASFILASDIAAHCSFQDLYPQAVAESLSLGRPVIVNPEVARCLPEEILESGAVLVCKDSDELAAAVVRLASNKAERVGLGEHGKRVVTSSLDWAKSADSALLLYAGTSSRPSSSR